MKKTVVLVILFILPIVAYLFFASGVNNFGKLPILTEKVADVFPTSTIPDTPYASKYVRGQDTSGNSGARDISNLASPISLKNKITILGFLGSDVEHKKGNAFNLNQKIYKRFFEFDDLQFVMVVPDGSQHRVAELKKELGNLTDMSKWTFVYGRPTQIQDFFEGLETDLALDENLATPYVFIIDKDMSLRGRAKDEDVGTKYGFNTASVADLNNKMVDDVKIILAEYRLALKKNTAERKK